MPFERDPSAVSLDEPSSSQRQRMERSLDGLDALLREVRLDWRQTTGPQANPLDIALPLLDNTSVGLAHRRSEFSELKKRIEQGLRVAVNEHFQSFNDSIGSYRDVVHAVAGSKMAISAIQENVAAVGEVTPEEQQSYAAMAGLNDNFKTYTEMVEVLTVIEHTQKVPAELDSAMSEKNYAKAQQLLQQVQTNADTYRLWDLPALANQQEYFSAQRETLFEILVEEIHNILYSKRHFPQFNSVHEIPQTMDASNKAMDYSTIEQFIVKSIDTDISETASLNHSAVETFIHTLNADTSEIDDEQTAVRELSAQEESNPFAQIHSLMSIIHKLGNLPKFVDIVVHRFGLELTQMINRVAEDTKLRHPKLVKLLNSPESTAPDTEESYRAVVTQDLFWNFFKKLLFFIQNVHVMTEVHRKITGGQALVQPQYTKDVGNAPYEGAVLYKFWGILHKEVQSLLITYISADDILNTMGSKLTNTSSTIKNSSKRPLFQFYQVEYDTFHTTQLKHVLQDLFPGFINSNDMLRIDSPYIEDTKFLKQSKIIPSDIMNMKYILEPFLLFIQGSSYLLAPPHDSEPIKFFNEFMKLEFLPQLEDSFVSEYFDEVENIDASELWEPTSELGLTQTGSSSGSKHVDHLEIIIQFKQFLDEVFFTLNTSLQFRSEFISIIFKLLNKFEDKLETTYRELFNELTSFLEPNKKLIEAFHGRSKISNDMLTSRNKMEFKNSHIFTLLKAFQNSLQLLLNWFDVLVKRVDLNKTDLNLSHIEKLRKSWFFFQVKPLTGNNQLDPLSLINTNKLILDDEMTGKFGAVVEDYKNIKAQVDKVLDVYHDVLLCM